MRIGIDARLVGGSSTGDSTYWTGLLHGLSKLSPDAEFLLYTNAAQPAEIPSHPSFRWNVLPGRSGRWWSFVQFPLRARADGCDVIHTQYALSPLVGRRGVTTIHDVSFRIGPHWFRTKDRFLLNALVPRAARRARKVITVSETSKKDLVSHLGLEPAKIAVTPLAPSHKLKNVPSTQAEPMLAELGVRRPYLLSVGTRWPRKNMRLAVEAVDLLPADLPHRLVLTGKSGWGESGNSSRLQTIGYVEERLLAALYSSADLYLAPSHYEGFGLTILEAFTCGCPVLCSVGGAQAEVAGDAAHVLAEEEPEAWAGAMKDLLTDSSKLQSMREKGLLRVGQFSWTETATRTLQVYREVAS
ncbi:MAG TPA: glycosyltransferase family 1 protein [Fimbriimonadaceae bacterium]|nr:glycosyltransferase family 1 protein [Fimbriimonadaceae bacterium]